MSRFALLAASATCALSLALVAVACGGETVVEDTPTLDSGTTSDSSAPPVESGAPADSGTDARDAAQECAPGLANTGADVAATPGEGGAPVFTAGGTVTDGNYELSEITTYAPIPVPITAKATVRKTGTKFEMILQVGQDEQKTEFTLATSGANFDLTATCGDARFEPSGTYEVVTVGGASVLRVASQVQGITVVFGFTKK